MSEKTNGTQPSGCTLLLIGFAIVVAFIGLVFIALYLYNLSGIK